MEVAFLLFWTFTKEQQKGFHMNGGIGLISSTITRRSTSKDKVRFWWRPKLLFIYFKTFWRAKNNSVYLWFECQAELQIRSNNNLFLSGYFGRDVFSLNKVLPIFMVILFWTKVEPSFLRQIIFKSLPYLQWLLLWVGLRFCWF
jgi:hypothetical protein